MDMAGMAHPSAITANRMKRKRMNIRIVTLGGILFSVVLLCRSLNMLLLVDSPWLIPSSLLSMHPAAGTLDERLQAKQLEALLRDVNRTLESYRKQLLEQLVHDMNMKQPTTLQSTSSSSLPACAELMSQPGSKLKYGDFITRHTIPHTWTPRRDGSREFDLLSICSLKRYTAVEARQCLANQHIHFIGDSLSRYMFNSLAYFIDKGRYPPRFPSPKAYGDECQYHVDEYNQSQCSEEGDPNICTEVDWFHHYSTKSWEMFYRALGGGADGGIFGGRMECNCLRNDGEKLQIENMLYASPLDNNGQRITLSIFQERGWDSDMTPMQGHYFTGCAFNGSCRFSESDHENLLARLRNNSYDYQQTFPEAIDPKIGVMKHLIPPVNVSIYNRGLWGKLDPARAKRIFPAMFNWTNGITGRCFYRTTTASGGGTSSDLHRHETQQKIRDEAVNAGCAFLDFGHITRDFGALFSHFPSPPGGGGLEWSDVYWDQVHFQPWVYEELNNVLLNVLCNSQKIPNLPQS